MASHLLAHSPVSDECKHLVNPNGYTVALAAVILVGILISYLPQHIKIIARRSSEGLSPWWVLLGGLSSVAAIANILVLPASRRDVACCKEVTGGECAAGMLGIAQIGLQWGCFMFIVMLFLTFFPTEPDADLSSSTASLTQIKAPPRRRDAVTVGSLILLSLFVIGLSSIAAVATDTSDHSRTQTWADFLGSVAGSLAAVQYVPQIYFTWKLKSVKSLSIITMLIQVPGAFLFAFSLWLRHGWPGWSTWLVYIVTGILQAVLLFLAVSYFLAARRAEREGIPADGGADEDVDGVEDRLREEVDERTALLGNGNKSRPVHGTQNRAVSDESARRLGMLYAATPPEHDSDRS